MRLITVQHKSVYDRLQSKGIYKANENNISEIMVKPYGFMQKQIGWDSTPIFLSPVGYYVEMGGAKFDNEHIAIELDIPDELCKIQRYYDWSDFIYFTELPWEFKESFNTEKYETVEDWAKTILDIKVTKDCNDPLQVTVRELRKEWIISMTTNIDEIEKLHNDTGGRNRLQELKYYTRKEDK